ncbi:helix-turn-helix domain-containing protein [Borborobacter arsenicus]|nr:helix-turn-helix transcriptional regulator [Pseudaminobacter arsenicus]
MTQTLSQIFIDWIRAGLKQPGKTQFELAKHLNIAHPQITQLLNGRRHLKIDEIPKIAAYLELDPPGFAADEREPIRGAANILSTLERIEGLKPENVAALMSVITGFLEANRARQQQPSPDDQPATAIPRRESQSSQ